jgi:hypothetical protein
MKTLLDAVKATGAGNNVKLTSPQFNHGVEVITTGNGTATSIVVELEASISGSTFASIGSATVTNDALFFVTDKMVEQVRANITTLTSGTKATGTLTASGTTPASGETVSIDGKVYKFQTASLASEGFVLIGSSYASAMDRLINAINYDGSPGVHYNCAAAHDSVSATAATASQMIVEALDYGTAGNSIVLTGSGATLTWSAGTLLLGTERQAITVNYTPYPSE